MRKHREKEEHNLWSTAHYNKADRNDKLIINLRDLSHTMRFLYEGRGSQKRILIVLDEIGNSITQRKLTERLGIQPGSASEVIAKLESAGYIRRTPNESDRRTADIELTETGKALAAEAKEQRMRRHEQMFSCLAEDEKNQLLSLLEKVNTDWKERYQGIRENHRQCKNGYRNHRHHEDTHCQKREDYQKSRDCQKREDYQKSEDHQKREVSQKGE